MHNNFLESLDVLIDYIVKKLKITSHGEFFNYFTYFMTNYIIYNFNTFTY